MIRILAIVMLLAGPVVAQNDAAAQARAAVAMLEEASGKLDDAKSARDRVRALTETVRAFETGLAAMRTGLREAAIREAQLSARLATRDVEVAQLLGVLQSMGRAGSPTSLLHPDGPTGTARAGMILAELTPALNKRADQLRRDLEDVQVLRTLQTDAAERLRTGLTEVQQARAVLNQAMAERTKLPTRFTQDPVRTAILIGSTETLDAFASGLSQIAVDVTEPAPQAALADAKGTLPLPVQGLILRRAGEPDAAGVVRPGVLIATRPRAIVTAPAAATIRYAGPLLDMGKVMILEPQADMLIVLAGLDLVYGEAGQVIAEGTPLGLMGGPAAPVSGELSTDGDDTGTERSETLYMEVRLDNEPQNPEDWFRTDKDG